MKKASNFGNPKSNVIPIGPLLKLQVKNNTNPQVLAY